MPAGSTNSRPVAFQELPRRCQSLATAIRECGVAAENVRGVFDAAVAVECEQCHIRMSGAELFDLAQPPDPAAAPFPRLERLRQGYCPRADCNSYHARMELKEIPGIIWSKVLTRADAAAAALDELEPPPAEVTEARRRTARWTLFGRAAIGLAAILILLLIRQWYVGGRIPLLREPQQFIADPSSVDRPTKP